MAEDSSPEEARLEAALRVQDRLGWTISILAILVTIGFMVAITLDWPLLGRTVFGQRVNGFVATAFCLLGLFIVFIILFSTVANRTDKLRATDDRHDAIGGDGQ